MKYFSLLLLTLSPLLFAADIELHKSPTCGCCQQWADAMTDEGHHVTIHNDSNLNDVKKNAGLPLPLGSCHTGFVEGYTVEGHVPPAVITWLLETKPQHIKGVAVPGMPADSVGMPNLLNKEKYMVYGYTDSGDIIELFEYQSDEMLKDYTL